MRRIYLLPTLFLILFSIPFSTNAQTDYQNSDTLAINEGITLEKNLGEITLYDYGQTLMKMKFYKYELSIGNLYGSIISLSTPTSTYGIYNNPETTIHLDLNQTEEFINKLYYLLQIDSMKDRILGRDVQVNNNKRLEAGTAFWVDKKQYSFTVSNDQGGSIYFNLKASDEDEVMEQSVIEGALAKGTSNFNHFTVNDYDEYRERVNKAIKRFQNLLHQVNNDENKISNENETGVRGQIVNYEPFIQEGYEVLNSSVHSTSDINISADILLERTPRRIKISDYQGQFDDYEIVTDDQLNFYVQEELNFNVFVDELLALLDKHNAKGLLDPKIVKEDNSIQASFMIFK